MIDQYQALNRNFRELIRDAIRNGEYAHLRGMNTKGSPNVAPMEYKSRVNIISRPVAFQRDGTRHLSVGRLETLVVIQSPLVNDRDYTAGIRIKEGPGIRFVFGEKLAKNEMLYGALYANIQSNGTQLKSHLQRGEYRDYVQGTLTIVDSALMRFKDMIASIGREDFDRIGKQKL